MLFLALISMTDLNSFQVGFLTNLSSIKWSKILIFTLAPCDNKRSKIPWEPVVFDSFLPILPPSVTVIKNIYLAPGLKSISGLSNLLLSLLLAGGLDFAVIGAKKAFGLERIDISDVWGGNFHWSSCCGGATHQTKEITGLVGLEVMMGTVVDHGEKRERRGRRSWRWARKESGEAIHG